MIGGIQGTTNTAPAMPRKDRNNSTAAAGKKPRLLVLASTYPRRKDDPEPGFVHELSRRLTTAFDVRAVGPHASGAEPFETMDGVDVVRYRYAPESLETLVNDGGIVTNLKRQPWKWLLVPGFILGLLWTAWRQIRRWRPAVVHAHWLIPQGLVMALLSALSSRTPPYLVTSHGADLFALRAWPLPALKRFVAGRAAALTVVSRAMAHELQRLGVPHEKISVQPMGVDLQTRFTPDESVTRSSSELLFVGRLVEKKGLRYLLEALPQIIDAHPDAYLTIAGFGPEEAALRRQSKALGIEEHVNFLGAVPQERLPALYRRAAVFVAPFVEAAGGDREGLGLVTVEAIGCGCPLIVSDMPAVRDVVADPGRRAVPADSTDLARKIIRLLATPPVDRKLTDDKLRERAIKQFDWAHVAAGYAETLDTPNH